MNIVTFYILIKSNEMMLRIASFQRISHSKQDRIAAILWKTRRSPSRAQTMVNISRVLEWTLAGAILFDNLGIKNEILLYITRIEAVTAHFHD